VHRVACDVAGPRRSQLELRITGTAHGRARGHARAGLRHVHVARSTDTRVFPCFTTRVRRR